MSGRPLVNVADVGFDIFLLLGQSNIVGADSTTDTRVDIPDPRIWQYSSTGSRIDTITQAVEPLDHRTPTGVGPGMEVARRYLETVPPNRRVLLVPCGHGGTAMRGNSSTDQAMNWSPVVKLATSLYDFAVAQLEEAVEAAGTGRHRLVAVIWGQGEQDVTNQTDGLIYRSDLDALIDGIRELDVPGADTAVFVINGMVPEWVALAPTTYKAPINAAHVDTPRRKERTAFAPGATDMNLTATSVHYTAAGAREMGRRALTAFHRARTNISGRAPATPTDVEITQSGTSIIVTWEQSTGRVLDYEVQYSDDAGAIWQDVLRTWPDLTASATQAGLTLTDSYQARVRAIGETENSAWSDPVSITLVDLPAQPTGLVVTPAGTGFTVSWSAAARAASYLVEARKTSLGGAWTTAVEASGLTATLTGLDPAVGYDVRVTAINAAGSGTASATSTGTTLAVTMLDVTSSQAAWCYSVARRVVSNYGGPLFEIYDPVWNTTQDIYPDGSGDADQAAMLAFTGTNSGYVRTLYDQSGNGFNLAQTDSTKMPRIVNAGTVDKVGTRVTMVFDGVDDYLVRSQGSFLGTGIYNTGAMTLLGVINGASQSAKYIVSEGQSGGTNGVYAPAMSTTSNGRLNRFLRGSGGTTIIAQDSTGTAPAILDSTTHQFTTRDDGSNFTRWVDNSATGSTAYTRSENPNTTLFGMGALVRSTPSSFIAGKLPEIVIFPTALSTTDRQTAQTNQKTYYGTP